MYIYIYRIKITDSDRKTETSKIYRNYKREKFSMEKLDVTSNLVE